MEEGLPRHGTLHNDRRSLSLLEHVMHVEKIFARLMEKLWNSTSLGSFFPSLFEADAPLSTSSALLQLTGIAQLRAALGASSWNLANIYSYWAERARVQRIVSRTVQDWRRHFARDRDCGEGRWGRRH